MSVLTTTITFQATLLKLYGKKNIIPIERLALTNFSLHSCEFLPGVACALVAFGSGLHQPSHLCLFLPALLKVMTH